MQTPADRMRILVCLVLLTTLGESKYWQKPGCHRVGYDLKLRIPGCVAFKVTTNACRGFCTSYAFPSVSATLSRNSEHLITSRAECCGIDATHEVSVTFRCIDGYRNVILKSAASCKCQVCRHN